MFFRIIIYVITGLWVLSIEYPDGRPVYFTFVNIFYESICLKPPPKSEVVQVRGFFLSVGYLIVGCWICIQDYDFSVWKRNKTAIKMSATKSISIEISSEINYSSNASFRVWLAEYYLIDMKALR